MSEPRVLVIGEALVDVVVGLDATTKEIPGGSPANVALGLARLGRQAELVCWIGKDARGELVRKHLESNGVALVEGSDGAEATSTAVAVIGDDGAASYRFDLDWNPPTPAPSKNIPLAVHTGSIGAIMEPGRLTVQAVLAAYRQTSTITYDPNVRPQLMGTPGDARPLVERLIAASDVVKCSDEDLAWLTGGADQEETLRSWLELGPAIAVVTRGPEGALAVTSSGLRLEVPSQPAVVADTVGAGDSFMGGIIDGLWTEGLLGAENREALHNISEEALRRVIAHAIAIAAITVSRPGANPPTRAELEAAAAAVEAEEVVTHEDAAAATAPETAAEETAPKNAVAPAAPEGAAKEAKHECCGNC